MVVLIFPYLSSLLPLIMYLHISLFFKQEMELSLVGLQNAGKTSLVNAIAVSDAFSAFTFWSSWLYMSVLFSRNIIPLILPDRRI